MNIVFTIANNSSVPYFNWFAKKAAEMKEHTFIFIALCKDKPEMINDVGHYGWECYWIPFDSAKRKIEMLKALFKAYSLFKKIKPDVVHTHLFDDALPCLLAAKLARVKVRAIVKADTGFHYEYTPKWVIADKFNNYNATHIIPPSNEAKKFVLEKEKADPKKTVMIHHGIPINVFTNVVDKFRQELINRYDLTDKIVIGTVSRLIEWKGYRYIINAARNIITAYPNSVFLFVGVGEQKSELEELVKNLQLENHIIFTGWVDRDYIPSLYSLFDVYVHAASYEPFGFVIPEAMMNGIPVVSTPTGSALDAIEHKENGFVAKYKDSNSLVEGIQYAIENGDSFRLQGKAIAEKMYDFNIMYENYIELYEKAIK